MKRNKPTTIPATVPVKLPKANPTIPAKIAMYNFLMFKILMKSVTMKSTKKFATFPKVDKHIS